MEQDQISEETLYDAVRNGDVETVKKALQSKPEWLEHRDGRGSTPLLLSTYYGHKELSEFLLSSGADINVEDSAGNTPLMGVCFKGYPELVELLIEHGAEVNHQSTMGATALIYAASFNKPEIAQRLIQAGAQTDLRDARGMTAMEHAEMQSSERLINLLKGT